MSRHLQSTPRTLTQFASSSMHTCARAALGGGDELPVVQRLIFLAEVAVFVVF